MATSEANVAIFDKDDMIANFYMYFFKCFEFQYSGMGGKPTSYNYEKCKDRIKWSGLKARDFIPLLDNMFNGFLGGLK